MKKLTEFLLGGLLAVTLCGCSQQEVAQTEKEAESCMNEAFSEFSTESEKSVESSAGMQERALHGISNPDASLEEQTLDIVE